MARRCTVFSLPPQAFENILKELSADDLFLLSTCSKRSFNLVKNTLVLFTNLGSHNSLSFKIHMRSDYFEVTLHYRHRLMLTWYFVGKHYYKRYRRESNPERSVTMNSGQGNEKTIVFRRKIEKVYEIASSSLQDFFQFIEHIGFLFDATTHEMKLSPACTEHLEAIQSVPILKKCSKVLIGSEDKGTISHDALRRAVEGFDCKKVILQCHIDRNFPLPLKYNCGLLYMCRSQVTNEHLNMFLHRWIGSSVKNRVSLDIWLMGDSRHKDEEQWGIYDDKCWQEPVDPEAQEEKWDLKKIAEGLTRFVVTFSKNQNVLVFQRETDGMELKLDIFHGQSATAIYLSSNNNQKDH